MGSGGGDVELRKVTLSKNNQRLMPKIDSNTGLELSKILKSKF